VRYSTCVENARHSTRNVQHRITDCCRGGCVSRKFWKDCELYSHEPALAAKEFLVNPFSPNDRERHDRIRRKNSVRYYGIVNAIHTSDSYVTPEDGMKHDNERQMKTYVVVKRNGKWLLALDQNTITSNP
jgi:hypothetical protein